MARKVIVQFVDDIDGSEEGVSTVQFGLDGVTYEIDLSGTNQTKLRDALAEFVSKGRRTGGRKYTAPSAPVVRTGEKSHAEFMRKNELANIREWARSHGWPDLKDRGRIPGAVMVAYQQQKEIDGQAPGGVAQEEPATPQAPEVSTETPEVPEGSPGATGELFHAPQPEQAPEGEKKPARRTRAKRVPVSQPEFTEATAEETPRVRSTTRSSAAPKGGRRAPGSTKQRSNAN